MVSALRDGDALGSRFDQSMGFAQITCAANRPGGSR
jgi:hypothetical protein